MKAQVTRDCRLVTVDSGLSLLECHSWVKEVLSWVEEVLSWTKECHSRSVFLESLVFLSPRMPECHSGGANDIGRVHPPRERKSRSRSYWCSPRPRWGNCKKGVAALRYSLSRSAQASSHACLVPLAGHGVSLGFVTKTEASEATYPHNFQHSMRGGLSRMSHGSRIRAFGKESKPCVCSASTTLDAFFVLSDSSFHLNFCSHWATGCASRTTASRPSRRQSYFPSPAPGVLTLSVRGLFVCHTLRT